MTSGPATSAGLSRRGRDLITAHAQFLRYAGVGVITTLLDLTLFSVFALAVGLAPLVANVVSTVITLCVSYLINRWFVFRSDAGAARTFVPFVTVTLFSGLIVQSVVIWAVIHTGHALTPDLSDSWLKPGAKIVAMGVGMVSNYLGYRWLFGRAAGAGSGAEDDAGGGPDRQDDDEDTVTEAPTHDAQPRTGAVLASVTSREAWRSRVGLVAVLGGTLAAVAAFIRPPGSGGGQQVGTISVATVVVAAGLSVAGLLVLQRVRPRVWAWSFALGLLFASLSVVGDWYGGPRPAHLDDLSAGRLLGLPLRWLGLIWLFTLGLAAVYEWVLRRRDAPASVGTGRASHFLDRLRGGCGKGPVLTLFVVLLAVRVPAWILFFPGILPFDTLRSYAQVRGASPWTSYEPLGHTGLVWVYNGLGNLLGLGDSGKVAIAVLVQIVAMAAAFTFVLVRMARWGVRPVVFWGALAWFSLSPVFGMFSIIQLKDVPFALAVVVFVTALGEVAVNREAAARWPWIVMAVSGIAAIVFRNNGIHVVLLTMLVLIVVLRGMRLRSLGVLLACLAGYVVYTGPVYSALDVGEARAVEMYSLPIQQSARIARENADALTPAQRTWIAENFDGSTPEELGKIYDPGVSDPPKERALRSWQSHTTGEFLSGWADLARAHPRSAVAATLAGTAGYWYPDAPLRDMFYTWSRNDVRDVHLDIPSGPPQDGLRKDMIDATLLNTNPDETRRGMTTNRGFMGPQFHTLPVVGMIISPALMAWAWLVIAVGLLLAGSRRRLIVLVPVAVLFLTLLASPVSGSIRYALVLFAALPVGVAMLSTSRPSTAQEVPATPTSS